MRQAVKWLALSLPLTAVVENVMGFGMADESGLSGLDFFRGEMEKLGYAVRVLQSDLSTWHQVSRRRSYCALLMSKSQHKAADSA